MLSAAILNEPLPKMEPQSKQQQFPVTCLELAKCVCCGLTEECTVEYIARVRDRWHGRWVCGLCCEAIDDEACRSETLITTEEALNRHMNFCKNFRSSSPPANPTDHLISAVIQLLRRGLESPRSVRSTPSSPRGEGESGGGSAAFARSSSCFSTLAN